MANRPPALFALVPPSPGRSISSAEVAATAIMNCWVCWLPTQATSAPAPNAPMMAPSVFAANSRPTTCAWSPPKRATAASASGKLAPQRMAPGSTVQRQRAMSNWKLNHGLVEMDGSIGQYGIEVPIMMPAHATAAHTPAWHQPSAVAGRARLRASADPTLLPMPRPSRNPARMRENVYVVPPKSSESRRVHTTSAESAVNPESAIARKMVRRSTRCAWAEAGPAAAARRPPASSGPSAPAGMRCGSYALTDATRNAAAATQAFNATATIVAVVRS